MQLSEMTIEQLKAAGFDTLCMIENGKRQLQAIEQEIIKKQKEEQEKIKKENEVLDMLKTEAKIKEGIMPTGEKQ